MKKAAVISELHTMIHSRLFGSRPWLAEYDIVDAISTKLEDLGLQETCGDHSHRATPLGKELDWDLLGVFLGIHYEWEMPMILEEHGLIDEVEAERLLEVLDTENAEQILRPTVQKAFLNYCNPSCRRH